MLQNQLVNMKSVYCSSSVLILTIIVSLSSVSLAIPIGLFGSNGWPVNSYWANDPDRIWKNGTGTYKNGTLIEMRTLNCEEDEIVCEDLRRCVARKLWCDGEQVGVHNERAILYNFISLDI